MINLRYLIHHLFLKFQKLNLYLKFLQHLKYLRYHLFLKSGWLNFVQLF